MSVEALFMAYEKAKAEITIFNRQVIFTILSSGKTCYYYGHIKDRAEETEYTCYDINLGSMNYSTMEHLSECKDVTGPTNPCNVILCYYVDSYEYTIP